MHHARSARQQKGATLVFVALWMGIALAGLMVLDIGNLFWQKRELQKIADLSALAGAVKPLDSACTSASASNAKLIAEANGMGGEDVFDAKHGKWEPVEENPLEKYFTESGASTSNSCHVTVKRLVPYFFIWPASAGGARELTAEATAINTSAREAQIAVRSQLLELNSDNSPILNMVVGGLLGGKLNLDVMGWRGLVGTQVELIKYLDLLKVELGLQEGGYDQVLDTDIGVGTLLNAMVDLLEKKGDTALVALDALNLIKDVAIPISGVKVKLGELLGLESGGGNAGLDVDLNVFDLLMGQIQLANSNSGVSADLSIPLGVANVSIALKIIEPPQLSFPGDPQLAKEDPYGDNKIYVRTAQTRLLISTDLLILDGITGAINGLLKILSPVLNLVNFLTGGVNIFLPAQYILTEVFPTPFRLDIVVDVAAAESYLTDYQCGNNPSVTTEVRRSVSDVRVGSWGESLQEAKKNAFSTTWLEKIKPIPIVRLDCRGCDGTNKITKQYFGGLGLKLDTILVSNASEITIDTPSEEYIFSETKNNNNELNIVKSLGATVQGLNALPALPADPDASTAGIGGILNALSTVLGSVLSVVNDLLVNIFSPILDPILNVLLRSLGLDIAQAGFSARLQCGGGHAELVY